jgi:ABC-2 type transport system permease protein
LSATAQIAYLGRRAFMRSIRQPGQMAFALIFPLFFVALFLSSMNMPRDLMENDWFRWIATVNPVSYLIEGLRSLVIVGWDAEALAIGFGIALAAIAVALSISSRAFRARMTRT